MKIPVKTDPFIFRTLVSDAGYEWLKGVDGKPRLVQRTAPGAGHHPYEPHSGLFREFAELSSTKDAIEEFAGKNGDLFSRYEPKQSVTREDGAVAFGASFVAWTQEIADMRIVVDLWEKIRHKEIAALKKLIKWRAKDVGYRLETPKRKSDVVLAHVDIPSTNLGRFSRKDVVLPARYALQRELNLRLSDPPVVPRLAWTPDHHQRLIFTPPDLLAAMWLQFAQAITGEFELYACDACGKFFQRGPGGRRTDATTCSDACRQRKRRHLSGGTRN